MARSLSNIFYKGIIAFPAATSNACRSFYQGLNRFSTTVPNDPETHENFKPTSEIKNSGLSWKDIVERVKLLVIKNFWMLKNPMMIYMKGTPELPRCGFSAKAVRILEKYDVPLKARNILEDPELKNAVKAFSKWPTFPQIFIKGELVGGTDIILDMHEKGDLERKFEEFEEELSEKE